MKPVEILQRLRAGNGFPRSALRVAATRREEMVPLFLDELDRYLAAGNRDRGDTYDLFFIFHLLGDWRETSAYRPLARLLRRPSDEIDAILGDAVTETSHRVMAAVFDGDPQPIHEIILDPGADPFIRSQMCLVPAMLVRSGRLDRKATLNFLRDCFLNLRPQGENPVWTGWQSAIAMLGAGEFSSLVKKAFDRGYIDPMWGRFDHFLRDLKWARNCEGLLEGTDEFTLFGNTVDELSSWAGFQNRKRRPPPNWTPFSPASNPFKGVGRNDPCPCGSGKKFKRCCLEREAVE